METAVVLESSTTITRVNLFFYLNFYDFKIWNNWSAGVSEVYNLCHVTTSAFCNERFCWEFDQVYLEVHADYKFAYY